MTMLESNRPPAKGQFKPMPRLLDLIRARVAQGASAEAVLDELQILVPRYREAYLAKLGLDAQANEVSR